MLAQVKKKALAGFTMSADFIEACADRQVGFATFCLQSSLENAKKLRTVKSFNDVVTSQKSYLKGLQEEFSSLATANTEALKTLGGSTKEYVTSIIKPASEAFAEQVATVLPGGEKKAARKGA